MNTHDPQTRYWHGCALLENICASRQLPWSGAKVRLLAGFEVIMPVSWPLSRRDQTYGKLSVRAGKVFSNEHPCTSYSSFIVDFQNYWLVFFQFSLWWIVVLPLRVKKYRDALLLRQKTHNEKNLTPIIHITGKSWVQTNVKQKRRPEGRRLVTGSCGGAWTYRGSSRVT